MCAASVSSWKGISRRESERGREVVVMRFG